MPAWRSTPAELRLAFVPDRRLAVTVVRLGLIASGSYLLQLAHTPFWSQGEGMWNPGVVALSFATYAVAFGLLGASVAARRPQRWLPVVLAAFLLGNAGSLYLAVTTQRAGAPIPDTVLLSTYSAHLLRLGENPYAWNMGDAYSAFRSSGHFMTPQLDGSSTSVLPYPSLHFLLLLPVLGFGLDGARAVYVLCHTLVGVLLFLRAPRTLRAIVLLPLWVSGEYLGFAINFVTDSVWALLVLGSVLTWRHRGWRAVLYGLACAYKQVPWLLGPFILLRLLIDDRDADPRPPLGRAAFFFGVGGAVFAVLNGPFMLVDFPAWAAAVIQPLHGHLIYLGTGLASTTQFGLLELPKEFYTTATLTVMATLLLLYAAHFPRWRSVVWALPGVVLWFSYRSLQSYFVYWVPLLVAALFADGAMRAPLAAREAGPAPGPGGLWERLNLLPLRAARYAQARRRWTSVVLAIASLLVLLAGALFLRTRQTVAVELVDTRLGSGAADAAEMVVVVHNRTRTPLHPRFAVQRASWQPYPWDIASGPPTLAPGQSGTFGIRTDLPYRALPLWEGGQIVVTEASGSYRVRGTLRIPPDESFADPGTIFNAHYLVRAGEAGIPWGWTLQRATEETPLVEPTRTEDGSRAIRLAFRVEPARPSWQGVGIAQGILFPDAALRIWVRPPDPGPEIDTQFASAYGVEFHDGRRRLWILFGPSRPSEGYLEPDHYCVRRWVPAGTWSEQSVELAAIYERLGWNLPPLRRTVRGNVELVTRGTSFTLFVAARNRAAPEWLSGVFGPARMEPGTDALQRRIRQRVERRTEYDRALSDLENGRRNLERARELMEKAAQRPPD